MSHWQQWDPWMKWEGSGDTPVFTVAGSITDWEGNPLSGVLVTLTGGYTDTTNASGAFLIVDVPAGSYTLTPTKSGVTFNPTSRAVTVVASNISGQDFAEQVYTVSGNVKDWEAANLSGVLVSVTGDKTASDTTDASGNYSIDLPNGSYTFTPTKSGVEFTPASTAVTVAGSAQSGKDFAQATHTLSGTVEDSAGTGIDGITVVLSGDASDSTVTAGGGAYSFSIPNGSYTITPSTSNAGRVISPTSANKTISGGAQTADFTERVYYSKNWNGESEIGILVERENDETATEGVIAWFAGPQSWNPTGFTHTARTQILSTKWTRFTASIATLPDIDLKFEILCCVSTSSGEPERGYHGPKLGSSSVASRIELNHQSYARALNMITNSVADGNDASASGAIVPAREVLDLYWCKYRVEYDATARTVKGTMVRADTGASLGTWTLTSDASKMGEVFSDGLNELVHTHNPDVAGTGWFYLARMWLGEGDDDWPGDT